MAEILLEPSSRSKIIPLSFDLNDTSASNAAQLMTKRQFNTADTDAWFQISLDDFVDTAGSFDITLFNLNDKSVFNHTGKPFTTNPFYYKLDSESDETTNEIRHAGRWIGQIVVTLANGDSATRKFIFDIEGHILDGADVQTILLEDYNALIATINTSKDLLAQYNVDYAALLVDLVAAETARTATYNQLVADQQANIEAFDVALDDGIVAANLAEKLEDFEATNNSRLLSAEQQLAEAKADLQAGIGAVTADAEVVTARISTVKGKTFTVLDERLEEIENDAVILATNSVINADFANGTTGWSTSSGVASIAANAGELTVNTTAQGNFGVFQNLVGAGIKYIAADFFNAEGMTLVNIGNNGVVVSIPGNTWKRASTLYTGEGLMRFYGQAKESLTYKMRRPLIINLTTAFGSGKEPSLAEMDRLLARFTNSWFAGTKPIQTIETLSQDVMLKANKVQEAWITPTLLNGWTGNIQYMKDELGFVHFKGRTVNLGSGTIFNLITGYRPLGYSCFQVPRVGYNTSHGVEVYDGVVILSTQVSSVDFSTVVFKAER